MPLLNIVGSSNTEGVWCMNPMYNNTVGRADSLKSTNRRSWMSDSDTGDVCYTDVQHQNEHSIYSAEVSEGNVNAVMHYKLKVTFNHDGFKSKSGFCFCF